MYKICHLTSAHPSTDGRIYLKECTSLAKHYETYLVAQGESRDENNVHVIGLGDLPKNRLERMVFFTQKVYKKALELDCDIYHLHDPELLPFALKLKKRGKHVLFDSHENTLEQMDDKEWIPRMLRGLISRSYRRYAEYVFQQLDGLISVTPHIVNQLRSINSNTWMITNYPIVKENVVYKPRLNSNLSICFTGGIEKQWCHETVIKAISNSNYKYHLCGPQNDAYVNSLSMLDGWDNVIAYGRVPFHQAQRIQNESHVGVAMLQPSNNTGGIQGTIGNTKLFEYMMAGLPIVCTNFTLWKEIIERHKCGICIAPNDQKALRDAFDYLNANPELAERMGRNGMHAVITEYNWTSQEKLLLEMYKKILK